MKERIFVVSDLHGMKNIYDVIVNYLDEVALCNPEDNIKLIINGDIIDRGPNSIEILQDVIDRMDNKKGYFSIDALAGNHELMMYEALQIGYNSFFALRNLSWYYRNNGGDKTAVAYDKLNDEEKYKIISFLDKLEIQKSINQEMLNTKGVIVTHAKASAMIKFLTDQFFVKIRLEDIKDDILNYYRTYDEMSTKHYEVMSTVWTRDDCEKNLGMKNYTTIIGHTPVRNTLGYNYNNDYKVLNIDGGCAALALNRANNITIPLVELDFDNKELIINRFDSKGNILPTHTITKNGIVQSKSKTKKI